jgi:hypothetical protein
MTALDGRSSEVLPGRALLQSDLSPPPPTALPSPSCASTLFFDLTLSFDDIVSREQLNVTQQVIDLHANCTRVLLDDIGTNDSNSSLIPWQA